MEHILVERMLRENKKLKEENKILRKIVDDVKNYKLTYLNNKLNESLKRLNQGKYYTREQLGL